MSFAYRGGALFGEQVDLAEVARRAGTPCYIYSAAAIRARYLEYDRAFGGLPHTVHYAVKANANLAVLKLLADLGAGFDIVSGGELYRVLRAGGDPRKVVFSGVGKTAAEVEYALGEGIFGFHCESEGELALIDSLAARAGVLRFGWTEEQTFYTQYGDWLAWSALAVAISCAGLRARRRP